MEELRPMDAEALHRHRSEGRGALLQTLSMSSTDRMVCLPRCSIALGCTGIFEGLKIITNIDMLARFLLSNMSNKIIQNPTSPSGEEFQLLPHFWFCRTPPLALCCLCGAMANGNGDAARSRSPPPTRGGTRVKEPCW